VAQKLITYPALVVFFSKSKIKGFSLLFKIAKFGSGMLTSSFFKLSEAIALLLKSIKRRNNNIFL
jgi:hypothetical protein